MIFALTPFEALCGFRDPAKSRDDPASPGSLPRARRSRRAAAADRAAGRPRGCPTRTPASGTAFERLIAGGRASRRPLRWWRSALDLRRSAGAVPAGAVHGAQPQRASTRGIPGVLISLLLNRISLAAGRSRLPPRRQRARLPARPGCGGHGLLRQRAPRRADPEVHRRARAPAHHRVQAGGRADARPRRFPASARSSTSRRSGNSSCSGSSWLPAARPSRSRSPARPW